MSWTFRLFACNVDDLAITCRNSPALADDVIRHVESATDADSKDLKILREILCSGLSGNWPDDQTTDAFSALCWLLEVTAENVTPPELAEFRSSGMMQETGLLRHFNQTDDTLPLPTSAVHAGYAGILKNTDMQAVIEAESDVDFSDSYVRRFHTFFLDTIEAIADEGNDLIFVMLS